MAPPVAWMRSMQTCAPIVCRTIGPPKKRGLVRGATEYARCTHVLGGIQRPIPVCFQIAMPGAVVGTKFGSLDAVEFFVEWIAPQLPRGRAASLETKTFSHRCPLAWFQATNPPSFQEGGKPVYTRDIRPKAVVCTDARTPHKKAHNVRFSRNEACTHPSDAKMPVFCVGAVRLRIEIADDDVRAMSLLGQ